MLARTQVEHKAEPSDNIIVQALQQLTQFDPEALWMLAIDGEYWKKDDGPTRIEREDDGYVEGVLSALAHGILRLDLEYTFEDILNFHHIALSALKNKKEGLEIGKVRKTNSQIIISPGCASETGIEMIYAVDNPIDGVLAEDREEKSATEAFNRIFHPKLGAMLDRGFPESKAIELTRSELEKHIALRMMTNCALAPPRGFGPTTEKGERTATWFAPEKEKDESISKSSEKKEIDDVLRRAKSSLKQGCGLLFFSPNAYTTTDRTLFSSHLQCLVSEALTRYYRDIRQAKTFDDKLIALSYLIKHCAWTHPFSDGNNRVFVNILLALLCLQQGILPGIFFNPNIFEGMSIKELCGRLKDAFATSQQILKDPNATVFEYSNAKLAPKMKEKFLEAGKRLFNNAHLMIEHLKKQTKDALPSVKVLVALSKLYKMPDLLDGLVPKEIAAQVRQSFGKS